MIIEASKKDNTFSLVRSFNNRQNDYALCWFDATNLLSDSMSVYLFPIE